MAEENIPRVMAEEHLPRVVAEEQVQRVVAEEGPSPPVMDEGPSPQKDDLWAYVDFPMQPYYEILKQPNKEPSPRQVYDKLPSETQVKEELLSQLSILLKPHLKEEGLNEESTTLQEIDEETNGQTLKMVFPRSTLDEARIIMAMMLTLRDCWVAREKYKRLIANPRVHEPNVYGFGGMHCVGGPRSFWNDPMVYTQTLKLLGWAVLIVLVAVIYKRLW